MCHSCHRNAAVVALPGARSGCPTALLRRVSTWTTASAITLVSKGRNGGARGGRVFRSGLVDFALEPKVVEAASNKHRYFVVDEIREAAR